MDSHSSKDVTAVLQAIEAGDSKAAAELLPLVYGELRKLAAARMARLRPGQTLQPTALVHEVYLALVGKKDPGWKGRGHFFGAAAQAMRELLVDAARRKAALKRGGDLSRAEAEEVEGAALEPALPVEDVLALDRALAKMKVEHPRKAEIVELRYFGGLTEEEIASLYEVTTRTIEREWRFARAWLHQALAEV
jgi:RNA polymerase sigma factor (TIGR02999 family)